MKPGTLAIIVRTAPEWQFAIGRVVTITGVVSSCMQTLYTFEPAVRKSAGFFNTCNRGERECFKPLDDPAAPEERVAEEELES